MRKRAKTYDALMISLIVHIVLLLMFSFYFATAPGRLDDVLPVVFLEEESIPEPKTRKPYLLPQIDPPTPRAMSTVTRSGQMPKRAVMFSDLTPAALIQRDDVVSPEAPIKSDAVPDFVTYTDTPMDAELAVPDTSLGDALHATSPSRLGVRQGLGAAGQGSSKLRHRGEDFHKRLTERQMESDPVDSTSLAEQTNIPQGLGIFKAKVMPGHGLIGEVYVPGGAIYTMPDFDSLSPIYTFLTANLDIHQRQYTEGFPTPTQLHIVENFAIRYRGQLFINSTGRYDFALNADDGAQLYIDGRLVVDNDGIHQPTYRRGSVGLTRGLHAVELRYFQGPRFHIALQWFYTPPGQRERIVPSEIIYRPGGSQTTQVRKSAVPDL